MNDKNEINKDDLNESSMTPPPIPDKQEKISDDSNSNENIEDNDTDTNDFSFVSPTLENNDDAEKDTSFVAEKSNNEENNDISELKQVGKKRFSIRNIFTIILNFYAICAFVKVLIEPIFPMKFAYLLIGLACFSPFRKLLVKKNVRKLFRILIYFFFFFTYFFISLIYFDELFEDEFNGDSVSEVQENKQKESVEKEKILTVDDILKDPSKYNGESVQVSGSVYSGYEIVNGDIANMKKGLFGSNNQRIILDGEEPEYENYSDVIVKGRIYQEGEETFIEVDSYEYTNAVAIASTQDSVDISSTFKLMKECSKGYSTLNWNQLLKNPTSLAGTYTYIPGKVVDVDVEDGITSGLIDTLGEDNPKDMVSFQIYGEVYDFSEGDMIAPMGYISSEEGQAYNSVTDESISTPLIIVDNPELWKMEYELDLSDTEVQDFLYGTYLAVDENDCDKDLGVSFDYNEKTIGGYSYYYSDKADYNPSITIPSMMMRGYDNAYIGMELVCDGIGHPVTPDSELYIMSFSFDLYGNEVLVNGLEYHKMP